MYTLNKFKEDIKDKDFSEISPLIFYDYLLEVKDENFDLHFYKNFHSDLNDKQDIYCIFHYYNFGIYEKRIPCEKFFYEVYPNFNFEEYSQIYSKKLINKTKYQVYNIFCYNLTNDYCNFQELEKDIKFYKIDFIKDYFKYNTSVSNMNYYDMILFFIDKKKEERRNKELNDIFTLYSRNITEISKILDIPPNPLSVCCKIIGIKKQYPEIIFDKKNFYKKYASFNHNFYKEFIGQQNFDEVDCIHDYLYYGRFMRYPISKEMELTYRKWIKTSKKIHIVIKNYYGGSFKYFIDIFEIYDNVSFIFIKTKNDLNKIKKDDILIINYIDKEYIEKIKGLKTSVDFKIIINIHDFYWFDNKYTVNNEGVYKNYLLPKNEINTKNIDFLNQCSCICPSKFVEEIYKKNGVYKLIKEEHIDYKTLESEPKKVILERTVNLAILHNYTEYKGKNIYEILKKKYQDKVFNNYKINFLTLFEDINCYYENEYFNLIDKHKIHGLLFLNQYGETWCYTLSKALKTGLPILYNNIGACRERIINNDLCFELFKNEKDIKKFVNSKLDLNIYHKFNKFIESTIKQHQQIDLEIYNPQHIDLDLKTNIFYDSLYSNLKISDIIDLYAIYFPQFHTIEQNNKNFYKGYTDFENIKILKEKQPNYKVLTPKQLDYNLLQPNIIEEQIKLAKEYGFKGFGCYYYWFSESMDQDNMIMRKVVDKMFEIEDSDFKLFFIWANEDWNNPSHGKPTKIINKYDTINLNKNVKNLVEYFKNPKYLVENNKPVLFIYHPWLFPGNKLDEFTQLLHDKCVSEGFKGCKVVVNDIEGGNKKYKNFSIQPNYKKYDSKEIDYQDFYEKMEFNRDTIQSFFFNFDSSPRMIKPERMDEVRKVINKDEINFKNNFFKTIKNYSFKNKGVDKILLINSWNEWGEQMAIEPSIEKGNYFLDLIKSWNSSPLSL